MKADETKIMVETIEGLNESYIDFIKTVNLTAKELKTAKKLWRDGNKSKLIKLGLTLIVFPEPTPISETIGTFLLAAAMVQKGIRRGTIYADDVYKAFQAALKETQNIAQSL